MPSRNVVKTYDSPAFYHVYNRGAGKQKIFLDDIDRMKFLSLLERHLVDRERRTLSENDEIYAVYEVELIAYCLMGNHFHLLLFQEGDRLEISRLMKSVSTAYSMYFNKRHKSKGHLFQEIFRASPISNESYLAHISRYIHLNPADYMHYEWSSLPEYLGRRRTDWVRPGKVLSMSSGKYVAYLEDYRGNRQDLLKSIEYDINI